MYKIIGYDSIKYWTIPVFKETLTLNHYTCCGWVCEYLFISCLFSSAKFSVRWTAWPFATLLVIDLGFKNGWVSKERKRIFAQNHILNSSLQERKG